MDLVVFHDSTLGRGGHSVVKLAKFKNNDVAIKIFNRKESQHYERELAFYKRDDIVHPSLLKMITFGHFFKNTHMYQYIVLPLCSYEIEYTYNPRIYLPALLSLLQYLHSKGLAVASFRASNFLVFNGVAVMVDVGNVCAFDDVKRHIPQFSTGNLIAGNKTTPWDDVVSLFYMFIHIENAYSLPWIINGGNTFDVEKLIKFAKKPSSFLEHVNADWHKLLVYMSENEKFDYCECNSLLPI